jgi:outer membrane protein TolC
LTIATDRYRPGLDPYLNVITAQTALLSSEQTTVSLSAERMTSSVQLIEAWGSGWNASQLASAASMIANYRNVKQSRLYCSRSHEPDNRAG